MSFKNWLRVFSRERDAAAGLAAFSRAAASGVSLPRLIELAATQLMIIARADRIGIWLESDARHLFLGFVLDSQAGAVPAEWNQLDVSAFPWKSVFQAATPVISDLQEKRHNNGAGKVQSARPAALSGLGSAVWWPVQSAGHLIGVVLLGFRHGPRNFPTWAAPFVWALLDQLGLAFHAQRQREEMESLRNERTEQPASQSAHRKKAVWLAMRADAAPNAEQYAAEELRALLEAVDSGVLLLDASGRIRTLNERFLHFFGLERNAAASLVGCDIKQLHEQLAPFVRDPETFSRRWRELALLGNSTAWDEVELVNPPGRSLQRFSRPVTDKSGRRLGWLELYREPTGQAPAHKPMLQTEKMAAIGQLVSGIAHELNNPLTSIMGYAQLLLARSPGSRVAAAERRVADAESVRETLREAKKIYLEAERAGRIVKNLLLFARSARVQRRAVDLNEIVHRTVALRSYELKIENILLELQLDPMLPPTLADPHQVQQVVLNLLVNAEQAILDGAVTESAEAAASAELGRIHIRTFSLPGAQPPRLALEISDSGPGVAPQHVSRLFDPFFTTKPVGLGTGLGLSIAYGIVHDHGGDIYLLESAHASPSASTMGGATFVIELPAFASREVAVNESPQDTLAGAELDGARDASAGQQDSEVPPAGRASILIVEDEPTVAQLIADVLKDEGHGVEVVLDSREGLARVARFGYDLIICDLRMPRIDGRAFYRSLVRSGHPAQLRILFVTGDTLSLRTLEFLDKAGLPYLAKPFKVEELKSIVARTLDDLRSRHTQSSSKNDLPDSDLSTELAPHPNAFLSPFARRAEEVRKP